MNTWQDISSAPKDREILLYSLNRDCTKIGFWYENKRINSDNEHLFMGPHWLKFNTDGIWAYWGQDISNNRNELNKIGFDPTHWQPLPLPPASNKQDGDV